jgi:hypothetical protein
MNITLTVISAYLIIGVLFSLFIKWGNETVVQKEERVHLGNIEHHIIALVWPIFVLIFVISFGVSLLKRFIKWF